MLQGYGDAVLRAETLEDQLLKSRKHAAAMQSKLDTAFAKYHNDIQEMQAKSDDLVRREQVASQQEQMYTTCLVECLLEVER
jgi:Skp family chaperone for outer membrane proteins